VTRPDRTIRHVAPRGHFYAKRLPLDLAQPSNVVAKDHGIGHQNQKIEIRLLMGCFTRMRTNEGEPKNVGARLGPSRGDGEEMGDRGSRHVDAA
jgi:hypothetical protein